MRKQSILVGLASIFFYSRTATAFFSLRRLNQQNQCASTSMATCQAATNDAADGSVETIRILALHGKGGDGEDFVSRLGSYQDLLKEKYATTLDIVAIDAPFPIDGGGFAWWSMPSFARSFNATKYEGFERSADLVLQTLEAKGPFDYIFGHSQGAILAAALLATQQFPVFPTSGFLLNGVAWPNPYSDQLNSLEYVSGEQNPRVLIITGLKDKINGPETQEQVEKALQKAGADVTTVTHAAGHNIPMQQEETLQTIIEWMVKKAPA